jgi:putative membrane protein
VLATIFAAILLIIMPEWLQQGWMHVKLTFVFLLILYHLKCHQIFKQLQSDEIKHTSKFMRLWNEGATFILFAVVFLVILKSAINWVFGVIGIFALAILLMIGFKIYKRMREKNQS